MPWMLGNRDGIPSVPVVVVREQSSSGLIGELGVLSQVVLHLDFCVVHSAGISEEKPG